MINYNTFPVRHLVAGLQGYLEWGIQPCAFLTRALQNDLTGAIAFADIECMRELRAIVRWMQLELPIPSWGSVESYCHVVESGGYGPLRRERAA